MARPMRTAASMLLFLLLVLALAACSQGDDGSHISGWPSHKITLSVAVVSPTEVQLSWTDPSTWYAQHPHDIYSDVMRDAAALVTTHEFVLTDSSVAPGTRYCYQVAVTGIYQGLFPGSYQTNSWASSEVCVVTPGP